MLQGILLDLLRPETWTVRGLSALEVKLRPHCPGLVTFGALAGKPVKGTGWSMLQGVHRLAG